MGATSRVGVWGYVAALCLSATVAQADPVRAGFDSSVLPPNDDGSVSAGLGFTANFYGVITTGVFVNNNGNATFDAALPDFTASSLLDTDRRIIAPFWADVDTRHRGLPVSYGQGTVDGRAAFGVNWLDVDYFSGFQIPPIILNSFQLVLIDRSDIAVGDFDFELNYRSIVWESGTSSGGNLLGLGGDSARVGYSNGIDVAFEQPGSAVNGAFLDSNLSDGLAHNTFNSGGVVGRFTYNVRDGVVVGPGGGPDPIPEPATIALLGLVAAGAAVRRWHKAKSA